MSTNSFKSRGRRTNEAEVLNKYFGEINIVDAKSDLWVFVTQDDIDCAVPGDPWNCALTKACERMFCTSRGIVFSASNGYVALPTGKNSELEVNRFRTPKETRKSLDTFDTTGEMSPGGYFLKAPTKSQTMEYSRKYQSNRRIELANGKEINPKNRIRGVKSAETRKNRRMRGLRDASYTKGE